MRLDSLYIYNVSFFVIYNSEFRQYTLYCLPSPYPFSLIAARINWIYLCYPIVTQYVC